MKSFIVVIGLLFFCIFPTVGLTWEAWHLNCFNFCWVKEEGTIRSNRIILATEMLKDIDFIYSFIPTPKPSQTNWLSKEATEIRGLEGEAKTKRLNKFYESSEYNHVTLYKNFTEIIDILKLIIKNNIILKSEMWLWSRLSIYLFDNIPFDASKAITILSKEGIFPEDFVKNYHSCYIPWSSPSFKCRYHDWGVYINRLIIYPYLESNVLPE